MYVNFNILNQLGSPSLNSNTFANRPAAGQVGRLFISTDTLAIYRDNGTSWDQIGGGAGISGSGTAGQVTYWDGTSSVTGESAFTYNASTNQLRVDGNISMANDAEAWGDLDALQIYNASFAGYLNNAYMSANAYYDGNDWVYIDSSTATWYSQTGATHTWARAASGTAGTTIGWITGMILDSNSRLGVNAAASDWLSTYKVVQLPFGASFYSRDNGTTVGLTSNAYLDNVGAGSWQRFTTGTAARYEMANDSHSWYVAASGSGAITYTQTFKINGSGNYGFGVEPNTWLSLIKGLQIGLGGSISSNTNAQNINISNNGYVNTGNNWISLNTGTSARFNVVGNRHEFFQANSTSVGSTITWNQVMALTSSTNFLINTTTDSGNRLRVNGSVRIDGQTAVPAGGSAGLHLIVNCDGTNYKIALLNV